MRYFITSIIGFSIIVLVSFINTEPPNGDGYYESDFDGVWAGYLDVKVEGVKSRLPVVLNFNSGNSSGEGFAILLDYYTGDFEGNKVLSLTNVKIKGKKLSFSFDAYEPDIDAKDYEPIIFDFTLKLKGSELKGKYKSDFKENPKGKATFYPMDSTKPLQGIWFWQDRQGVIVHWLQLKQNGQVSGYAFGFDILGELKSTDFSNNIFTGSFSISGRTKSFKLTYSSKKNWLKGTFSYQGGETYKVTMLPLGTKGKTIKVKSVSPNEIQAGSPTVKPGATSELTIKGKNFADGAVVHFDNKNIEICCIKFVASKQLKCNVTIPATVADGTKVGVRVVNPDNRQAEIANAFTITSGDGGNGTTVSYAGDIQPVFDTNCTGCHGVGGNAGLNLNPGVSYGNIVNVPSSQMPNLMRIKPGNPANSYLIRKIKGEGISGGRMPLGRSPLSAAVIGKFETWVNEGAQDN